MKQNRKYYARVTKVVAFFFYPVTKYTAELLVLQSKRREACDETGLINHSSANLTSFVKQTGTGETN